MSAIDAVLFDLDDTLCAYRRSGGELLDIAFDDVGVEPLFDIGAYHEQYDEHLGTVEDMERFRERCFATLADQRGRDSELGREVARAYAAERDQSNVEVLEGARDAVEALSTDHHVGLVTNGLPDMQREKLAATGFDDAFDVEVFAGYDAPAKPEPDPFHHALDSLDVDPGRAVHVGNSLRTDVPGAQAAGLRAAWLRQHDDDPDPEPEYVVDALDDLVTPPWR